MKRTREKTVHNPPWSAMVLCFSALATVFSASSGGQVSTQNPLIREGGFPPDFELPRLTFRVYEMGKTVGVIDEKNTIRLSSFRGKKPVCLIMSSYT
jgi:hypothetical protein